MKTMFSSLSFAAILAVFALPAAHAETFDASLAAPGVYTGTGNPNSDFAVVDSGNVELGLKAITRGVAPPIVPSGNNYVYSPGPGTSAALATWNFLFSVNTGSDPLSDYTFRIAILDDTTGNTSFFDPSPTGLPDDAQVSGTNGPDGFQNSENLGFGFLTGFNPKAFDEYTITLSATPTGGNAITDTINVVPTPEPSSLVLLCTGLVGGVGTMLRRRRTA